MCLVRRFVLSFMRFNILTRCVHIEGRFNILPDLVSRFKVEEFHLASATDGQRADSDSKFPASNREVKYSATECINIPGY